MKTFRKFVLLADVDNTKLSFEELSRIIKRVEALGTINYIKLYGCNDKRLKEFEEIINGRCCDTAPILRTKGKSRKLVQDTRIMIDAMRLPTAALLILCDNRRRGDYGYLLSGFKAMGKFIAGRFNDDININFCDIYLVDFESGASV